MKKITFRLFFISLFVFYPAALKALEAGYLFSICEPYKLRNYESQHTTNIHEDLESLRDDLMCVNVTDTILDFGASLCFQAFNDKISKTEMGELYYYAISVDIQHQDAIDAFIEQYNPAFEKAPAHMSMIQALHNVSSLNKCIVLK